MTKENIIRQVKALNLPANSYVVFGSGPMAIAGIREADDIDLLVSEEVHRSLAHAGWRKLQKAPDDTSLVKDNIEAHDNWNFSAYSPTLEHLLSTATIVDGVPFASLHEVRKWKSELARPKDVIDIKLIDEHLAKRG